MPLLPKNFKLAGLFLLLPGLILSAARFYFDIKIRILDIKVFAIYSSFFESKYFTFIQNNFTEETAGALVLLGLIFIAFSKEEIENQEIMYLRFRSMFISVIIFLSSVLLSILFVFGFGFINFLIGEILLFPAVYILIFRFHYRLHIKSRRLITSGMSR